MLQLSRQFRRPALWLLLAAGVLFLSACGGRITNTNWAGLSTDGNRVYLAFGPRVLAFEPETQTLNWIYPVENGAVQFYAAPSADNGQVAFGDYGRQGGFFSPRVTTSVYALENVDSGVPTEQWINSDSVTDKVVAPPLHVNGKLYVGTADNHMVALDPANGSELWDFETSHAIWGRPEYRDGILYVNSMDWSVYALNADSGELVWQTELGGALASQPVLGDDLLYVSSFDGNVHALDIASGEERWAAAATDWVWGAPALADGTLYFSDIQGNLFAVDALTGEQKWTKATGLVVQTNPVVAHDMVFVASDRPGDPPTGVLTAYSVEDGSQIWSQATSAPLYAAPVVVGEDTIVIASPSSDTLLIGYDLATGQELWRYALPESAN